MPVTNATELDSLPQSQLRYSVCTLVSRPQEYQDMVDSFHKAGFSKDFCEYLYIDNSIQNKYDAYAGLNKFLLEAKGKYIILCHQDILLNYDNITVLEERINELDSIDPNWAILSNAGASNVKDVVYKITYSDLVTTTKGTMPAKAKSVDENFILVKHSANLSLSGNLKGFHLYGTDLCIIAKVLGYNSYIVEFNLLHKSRGTADASFKKMEEAIREKYIQAFRGRYIETTCTKFYISGSKFQTWFFNTKPMMFLARQYYKLRLRLK